VQQVRQLAATL
jgi:hypothetical protein